ncbi:hypothetical protein AB0I39_28040 [Kitasatospora purpeofusca]|uniref:hypothetical protein n=1 Tax=Kitasatospora purpeofusca TaxID=67352 RepID=UPI0033FBDE19
MGRAGVRARRGPTPGHRDLVVAAALRAELTVHGWDRNWSDPRPGAIGPGRRWGSTAERRGHDGAGRFEARLTVRIPAQLATRLQHAVHWESGATEHRLQMLAGRPEHRAEIQRLQDALVTTGDVLRAAVRRAAAESAA